MTLQHYLLSPSLIFVHSTDVEGKKTDWMVWKLATTRGTVDLYDNNIYEDDKMSAYKVSP